LQFQQAEVHPCDAMMSMKEIDIAAIGSTTVSDEKSRIGPKAKSERVRC
jgi:hypothetical protein